MCLKKRIFLTIENKEERIKIKHNTDIKNPVKKTHHQKSKTNCYLGKNIYPRCMTYKM